MQLLNLSQLKLQFVSTLLFYLCPDWLVKKLNSEIFILCFCCSLYRGGPPQKQKNLREDLCVTIVNCFQGQLIFPRMCGKWLVDDLIGWLIECANWQLKAKQDIILLYDMILYLLQWCYWSRVNIFLILASPPVQLLALTDLDNKNLISI